MSLFALSIVYGIIMHNIIRPKRRAEEKLHRIGCESRKIKRLIKDGTIDVTEVCTR